MKILHGHFLTSAGEGGGGGLQDSYCVTIKFN